MALSFSRVDRAILVARPGQRVGRRGRAALRSRQRVTSAADRRRSEESGKTPSTRRRCKHRRAAAGPDRMRGGSLARSSVRPSTTWFGFMQPVKLSATMSAAVRGRASTMSHSGVCTPSETQRAALQRQHRLGHQQAQAVRLAREGGEQHAGRPASGAVRHARDGLAQHHLHRLGVDMLLEDLHLAAHPGVADGRVQRCHDLDHEAGHAEARRAAGSDRCAGRAHRGRARDRGSAADRPGPRRSTARCGGSTVGPASAMQLFQRQRNDAAGPVAGIEQPLDDAQLLDLFERVGAFARRIALGVGKP